MADRQLSTAVIAAVLLGVAVACIAVGVGCAVATAGALSWLTGQPFELGAALRSGIVVSLGFLALIVWQSLRDWHRTRGDRHR